MDATALIAALQDAVPGVSVEPAASADRHPTLFVPRDDVPRVMRAARDREDLAFTLLAELTAADYWPREPRFEVIYILVSLAHRHRVRLKVALHGNDARIPTVCDVWPAANWLEREVWDMFGVVFDGHPDPRRLLMPEDWQGYPLRKDYPVQIRKRAQSAEPLQLTPEEFRANVERDRLRRT